MPEAALLRLSDIVSNPKKGQVGILPISESTFRRGVEEGRYPKPVRLSQRTVAWKTSDIMKLANGEEVIENK